jgi:hypothetical protein
MNEIKNIMWDLKEELNNNTEIFLKNQIVILEKKAQHPK